MIPPQDLKNRSFSRTVRGYNPIEVDDYIAFLLGKYEQLHNENLELEKRLHIVSGKYEELANDEEAIRNAVTQAQKLSETMISSAEKSAEEIIDKVKARCEDIIEDAQIKVEAEQKKLAELRLSAAEFKEMLLREYTRYLKSLRETAIPSVESVQEEFPTRELIKAAALESLVPEEIIERAVVTPAKDPSLEEFKRFVNPLRKRMTREEKEALKKAKAQGRRVSGRMTAEILQSHVDDEDLSDTPPSELLAESPDMSVEDALLSVGDADSSSSSQNAEDPTTQPEDAVASSADTE